MNTYFMSLFPLPTGVANHIEKFHRDFLCSGIGEDFKFHLVDRSKVCSPMFEGRLGVYNLRMFDRALLEKCL